MDFKNFDFEVQNKVAIITLNNTSREAEEHNASFVPFGVMNPRR